MSPNHDVCTGLYLRPKVELRRGQGHTAGSSRELKKLGVESKERHFNLFAYNEVYSSSVTSHGRDVFVVGPIVVLTTNN